MSTGPLFVGTGPLPAPEPPVGPSEAPGSIFANAAFVRLWLAQAGSQLGDRIHHVALMWWTLESTGSLAATGAVMIATTLPAVLLGPVAGALADRHSRKALMVTADLGRAAIVAGLAALAASHQLGFGWLVAGSALLASLTAIFMPANMAMLPAAVRQDQLLRANSLMETTLQTASLVGPALGGAIVAAVGAGPAFGLNAASFLLSAALLLGLGSPAVAPGGAHESFGASLKGAFGLLGRMPTIAGLLVCFACLNFFSVSILLFLPYFARTVFAVGAAGLGALEAAVAAGMLAAALLWARRGKLERRFPLFFGCLVGIAAMYVVMGLWPRFEVYLAALAVTGALFASINVTVMAFFGERVPPGEMGRFMGLLTSLVFGLMPLSYGVFGLLSGQVPPATLLLVNGGAIAVVAAALWRVPGLKEQ